MMRRAARGRGCIAIGLMLLIAGCATDTGERTDRHPPPTPEETRALTGRLLPPKTPDAAGWAADIQVAFSLLGLAPTPESLCAVIAVIEQESSFRADPAVPNLGTIARKEIDVRADRLGIPSLVVRTALRLESPDGRSYRDRIDAAKTERELSEIFEDLIGAVPLGKRLFAGWNPIRTGGPMQVAIAYAEAHAADKRYPYADAGSIRREVFTRRGGLYFGIAHLLDYPASYDRSLYRFADFNAGQYASRNAAFQNALRLLTGTALALDGDLVRQRNGVATEPGETERAARSAGPQLGLDDAAIRHALLQGTGPGFDRTELYRRVFALADERRGAPLPRAVLPQIRLQGPKISRNLTTAWFAERVDGRRARCLARIGPPAGRAGRSQHEDLARIEEMSRVESDLDSPHQVQRVLAGLLREEPHLVQADAVLPGTGPVQ